jgi:phosphoserine phosphatase RsbU/P
MMTSVAEEPRGLSEGAPPRVLVADDQPDVLEALRLLLKTRGYRVVTAASPAAVREALGSGSFDLLLIDLNYARDTTSGREGLDLLTELRTIASLPPVVVMTGWATVSLAIDAMHRGVSDFIQKPWDNELLVETLRRQIEGYRARRQADARAAQLESHSRSIETELRRHELEMEEARRVQQGFLPRELPEIPGFEIAAAWRPALGVGGDYFGVMPLGGDKFALAVADVAGKGIPAALLMSNMQATVRALSSAETRPAELCGALGRALRNSLADDRFVSFFYALLDVSSRRLIYTNAGHNPALLVRADGSWQRLAEGGAVLGIATEDRFTEEESQLVPGDRLLLFTDGVTETWNGVEEFGETRLVALACEHRNLPAAELHQLVLDKLVEFNGNRFEDDMTLIVLAAE